MNMRTILLSTLIAATFAWKTTVSAGEVEGAKVFDSAAPTVVFISTSTSAGETRTGSGVIVSPDEVLTNCHVVDGAAAVEVTFLDGKISQGAFSGRFGGLDLCKIQVPTSNRRPAKPGSLKDTQPGQVVYALGSPLGLKASISNGIVAAVREVEGIKLIQTTAPISPGSSGGGLFNRYGQLVGITTSTYTRGQNVNFAIPIEYATLVPLSAASAPESDAPSSVSFKGIPFGISREAFQKSFPAARCEAESSGNCRGATDFIGQPATFSAFFGDGGLYLAYIRIYSNEPDRLFTDATSTLWDRFKFPFTLEPGSVIRWKWTEAARKDQFVILVKCGGDAECINTERPGIMVFLGNSRYKSVKRKDF